MAATMLMPKLPAMRHLGKVLGRTRTTRTRLRRTTKTMMETAHPRSQPSHGGEGKEEDLADHQRLTSVLQKLATMGASPARLSSAREDDP
jgi:hypothetical protein